MTDDPSPPQLQPPPRVPTVRTDGDRAVRPGSNRSSSRLSKIAYGVLFGSLGIALVGVFLILPRWTAERQIPQPPRQPAADPGLQEPSEAIPAPPARTPTIQPTPLDVPTPGQRRASPPPQRPAAATVAPTRTSPAEDGFVIAMSRGLGALEQQQWQTAREAFEEASRLRPGAPEAADGLARAKAAERRELVRTGILRGRDLEASESWSAAETEYARALALDPEAAGALDGIERASERAELDERLAYHISNPGRLASPAVFEDASNQLAEARDLDPKGPRLAQQIAKLERLLDAASTPVAVVLESDDATEVLVYRVGRLGSFTRRELSLRPGSYTAVGSRDGFRDVRVQFEVTPGAAQRQPIVVRCTEGL